MKKYLLGLLLIVLIVPSIAFASWWNPFSWFNNWSFFHRAKVQQVEIQKTDTNSEIEKLRKEVDDLKKQQGKTGQSTNTAGVVNQIIPDQIPAQAPAPKATITPVVTTQSPDYKPQILNILNAAKDNYTQLLHYSGECASMVSQRKTAVQQLMSPGRAITLAKITFDSYLTKAYTLFYDIGDSEIDSCEQSKVYCEVTIPSAINSNINKINNDMMAVQNSSKPATSDDLVAYQVAYFGSNILENTRANIKDVIDRANKMIVTTNSQYTQILTLMHQYVSNVTTPTAPLVQYVPVAPSLPQLPQTTRCTITGGSGGLQAYVNCTTY